MCALTWRATVMSLLVVSQMMLGPLTTHSLEDDEIEKHLNRLNKPAVKSIAPSFSPKMEKSVHASDPHPLQPSLQKSEGCPDGTVPIRRVQKDDHVRATSVETHGIRRIAGIGTVESAEVILDSGGPYVASSAVLNVWNAPVEANEWSNGHLTISDGNMYRIEAGWMVNPQLHEDNITHVFGYWTADGGEKTGCFNLLCPGFVQVTWDYILGFTLLDSSVHAGEQNTLKINIQMGDANDRWWLLIEDFVVGYWPVELFGNSTSFTAASTVSWGGSVLNTNHGGRHTNSKMGSGQPAAERWSKAAFVEDVTVRLHTNDSEPSIRPNRELLKSSADNDRCYSVLINEDANDPRFMYFGGPGGDCVTP